MSRKLDDLEPETRAMAEGLLLDAKEIGIELVVTQTYRTYAEQDALYALGRDKNGKVINPGAVVTYARGGESWHCFRRALDIAFRQGKKNVTWDGPWGVVGKLGERRGFAWGGRWKKPDRPHFENPAGHTLAELREAHESGEIDQEGT